MSRYAQACCKVDPAAFVKAMGWVSTQNLLARVTWKRAACTALSLSSFAPPASKKHLYGRGVVRLADLPPNAVGGGWWLVVRSSWDLRHAPVHDQRRELVGRRELDHGRLAQAPRPPPALSDLPSCVRLVAGCGMECHTFVGMVAPKTFSYLLVNYLFFSAGQRPQNQGQGLKVRATPPQGRLLLAQHPPTKKRTKVQQ